MKTDLGMYENHNYKGGPLWRRLCWYVASRLFLKTSILYPYGFKVWMLRLFGAKIGKNVVIKPGVHIKYPWLLEMGNFVWLGENVWIDNLAKVSIASHVCVSQGAMLLTGNHNYKKSSFDLILGPITLEEGVWIGAQTVVCPGVTCKSHSVLAVGSVANKDLLPNTIYQGNPAVAQKGRFITISES
jgi:putative colanic acid biosynthesis acetyltransferase WcaF